MPNALSDIALEQLKRAVQIKEQIEALENQIRRILGEATPTPRTSDAPFQFRRGRPGRPPGPARGRKRTPEEIKARNAAYQRERRRRLRSAGLPAR